MGGNQTKNTHTQANNLHKQKKSHEWGADKEVKRDNIITSIIINQYELYFLSSTSLELLSLARGFSIILIRTTLTNYLVFPSQ